MVGGRDADRVDRAVGQDLAEIPNLLGLVACPPGGGSSAFQVGLVDVTDRADSDAGLVHRSFEILGTHHTDADKGGGDAVVGRDSRGAKS